MLTRSGLQTLGRGSILSDVVGVDGLTYLPSLPLLSSPSTPTTSLSERPRPKAPYSSSEKSATLMLQPETGQRMEYAGKVTHRE